MSQHPEIFLPKRKSTNFFAFDGEKPKFNGPGDDARENNRSIVSWDAYIEVFQESIFEKAIGEVSPIYFDIPEKTACAIKHYLPDAKLICILRNPIEAAFSRFCHLLRDGDENVTIFSKALQKENDRIKKNYAPIWHYSTQGFYYQKLKYYFDFFDQKKILILLYDDLKNHPDSVLSKIFSFLEVDHKFKVDFSSRYNVSNTVTISKNLTVKKLVLDENLLKKTTRFILPNNVRKKMRSIILDINSMQPVFDISTKKLLIEMYRDDVVELQKVLDLDLSYWLSC
jgi:hypothetical protein